MDEKSFAIIKNPVASPDEKFKIVRKLIVKEMPELEHKELRGMLSHIAHYHYKKHLEVSEEEIQLYDLLLKNQLNPNTVYRWLLLSRINNDLKRSINQGKLTQKQALRLNTERNQKKAINLSLQIINEARSIMLEL